MTVILLLVQTLITFLLYFAPTPGASGIAELLSTAVMSSVYIPRELGPLYTLIWRSILSYFTLAFGFFVFMRWVRRRGRLDQEALDPEDDSLPIPAGTTG